MSLAVIDAREWQNLFDLQTGDMVSSEDAVVKTVRHILKTHPYPGDTESESNRWVTDTALDLIDAYDPQLACISYAQQYFANRYFPYDAASRRKLFEHVFDEAERFIQASGMAPVIVGTGDMVPSGRELDLCRLDGLALSSHWSARYAGLHDPSERDLKEVTNMSGIECMASREEWLALFDTPVAEPYRLPDYLLVAEEGWCFKTVGQPLRRSIMVPGKGFEIPVATTLGCVSHITDLQRFLLSHLARERIALILIEGIGLAEFPLSHNPCRNNRDWFYYEPGEGLYLTLSTGRHQVFAYPPGYRYFDDVEEPKAYPFSGYFREMPRSTIGEVYSGRSIAVGNRSMFMHTAFGADLSIECFARNLFNQGLLAVIRNLCREYR